MKRFSFLVFLVMGSMACGSSSNPQTPSEQDATGDAPVPGEIVDTDTSDSDTSEECDCSGVVVDECHETSCFEGACLLSEVSGPCDDGDVCTEDDYCLVGVCVGNALSGCCTSDCSGKECGDDGCGGSCGTCELGESCDGEGQCFEFVALGDTCADAQVITELPFQGAGDTIGLENDYEAPAMSCFSSSQGQWTEDAVYSYTATFDGYLTLSVAGTNTSVYVVRDCADIKYSCAANMNEFGGFAGMNQAPVTAGETYFIIVESDAGTGYTLNLSACYPDCAGKECGLDGCGHWCGFCESPDVLNHWECASNDTCICIPDCYDNVCGDDGCGSSCGECGAGEYCAPKGGECVAAGQVGDTCADAIPITGSSFTYSGDTTGMGNDYYSWWACGGDYFGEDAPDIAFVLQPEVTTSYLIELESEGFLERLWATTDCANPLSWIQCKYQAFNLGERLFIEAPAGRPTYVIVSAQNSGGGPFTLTATACTTPGSCPSVALHGEYCSYAPSIESLPFTKTSAYLDGAFDAYHLEPGGSCDIPKFVGHKSDEEVFVFTPQETASYKFSVVSSGQLDPLLYVATDCIDLKTGCVAWVDNTGIAAEESLIFEGTAGVTYYLILDGFTEFSGGYTLTLDVAP